MNTKKYVILAALLSVLTACGKPVPPEKAAFVGEWAGKGVSLVITQEGHVDYESKNGGVSTSISAPLQGFTGDNFEVGVGPMTTTFVVGKAPHRDGEKMKMTVDNVELEKMD